MRKEIKTGIRNAAFIAGAVLIAKTASPDSAIAQGQNIEANLKATSIEQVKNDAETKEPVIGEALSIQPSFADMTKESNYFEAVSELHNRGVINGYRIETENEVFSEFRPNLPVTRAQFAKIITNAFGFEVTEDSWDDQNPPFKDLGPDDPNSLYPHDYVAQAAVNGIIKGNEGYFSPNAPITRAQEVAMVVRAIKTVAPGAINEPDIGFNAPINVGSVLQKEMDIAFYNGLVSGLNWADGDAAKSMDRGETCQLVWNALEKVEERVKDKELVEATFVEADPSDFDSFEFFRSLEFKTGKEFKSSVYFDVQDPKNPKGESIRYYLLKTTGGERYFIRDESSGLNPEKLSVGVDRVGEDEINYLEVSLGKKTADGKIEPLLVYELPTNISFSPDSYEGDELMVTSEVVDALKDSPIVRVVKGNESFNFTPQDYGIDFNILTNNL